MSRTTVKLIYPDGRIENIHELSNSWGSAAFIWTRLSEYYLKDEFAWSVGGKSEDLWKLASDSRLPKYQRAVLLSTFDHAIIEREHFYTMAIWYRKFVEWAGTRGQSCHLLEIESLLMTYRDSDCLGMCFQQTSVSEDPWYDYSHEDDDGPQPPLDLTTHPHFFVFDELKKQETEPTTAVA